MTTPIVSRQPLALLYAPEDEAFAQRIAAQLRQAAYHVTTTTSAPPNADATVLVVLSPAALQSAAFTAAWHAAFAQHQRIFPIVAHACAIPPELSLFQWIIFDGREAAALIDVQRALATDTGKRVLPISRRALITALAAGVLVLALIGGGIIALLLARSPRQIVALPTPTPQTHGRTQTFPLPQPLFTVDQLVTASDGSLWLNGFLGSHLAHFDPQTNHFTLINLPGNAAASDFVAMPDNTMWYVDNAHDNDDSIGQIGHILADGTIQTYPVTKNGFSYGDLLASHLAVTADGSVWFTYVDELAKRTPDGSYHYLTIPDLSLTILHSADDEIVAGPDGSIWFGQNGYGGVIRLLPNGQFQHYAFARADLVPYDFVMGRDGTLWCALADGEIVRVTSGGVVHEYHIDSSPETAHLVIAGLAVADNSVWVSAKSANNVVQCSLDGVVQHIYTVPTNYSLAIAVGKDQTIWGAAAGSLIHLYP